MSPLRSPSVSPWPHRLALVLALMTFPLVWVGGLVTSHDAGMSVPDWPSTFGYNLFLYPWQTWVFGPYDVFIEHGHRLLGAAVGLLAIALAVVAWRAEPRRWVRGLVWAALGGVIAQGLLGGLRVVLDARLLAQLHGCLGPTFFALSAVLVLVTSPRWHATPPPPESDRAAPFRRLAVATSGLAFAQLVLGSQVRHGVDGGDPAMFRAAVLFHVGLAFVVAGAIGALFVRCRGRALPAPLPGLALALVVLTMAQLLLGAGAWIGNYGAPAWARETSWGHALGFDAYTVSRHGWLQVWSSTAHVAIGALIVALSATLAVASFRFTSAAPVRLSAPSASWGMSA